MAHVSHRLTNAWEGALAGGGDPATSPLYVFGPFLKLIVVAGVANVTFGASVWLVVLTVACVSGMYRLVMRWITDGSGGSGLCEEEFGSWAVKINAAITFVEYTLTFLVSIAALATFMADRISWLAGSFFHVPYRTVLAVGFSLVTGFLVNRGPRVAARAFGPATAAILVLLWAMVIATIWKRGLSLPSFDIRALSPAYLHFTLGGYARILALMTGVEVFANLVSAYEGPAAKRSRLAFRSLVIIMTTTSITMLVVGPAMFALADPRNESVSVFTQTMDHLLPAPLPVVGTLIGIAVLLSAAAASAQGLQNLALGLRYRHYIPARFGQRNRFDVADKPVWFQVGIVCVCFVAFGTHEETYLALYAAGVFVLLSLTGWAALKRLMRGLRAEFRWRGLGTLLGTLLAATLSSIATAIIFRERFVEGAWSYFVLIPIVYAAFSYFRRRLGDPSPVEHRLGHLAADIIAVPSVVSVSGGRSLRRILVPLDGTIYAEQALPIADRLASASGAAIDLVSVRRRDTVADEASLKSYLHRVAEQVARGEVEVEEHVVESDAAATAIITMGRDTACDVVIQTTRKWSREGTARTVALSTAVPLLVLKPTDAYRTRRCAFERILVALDGSEVAERTVASAVTLARLFRSEVILLSVPEGTESETYPEQIAAYQARLLAQMGREGISARAIAAGSGPARTIVSVSESERVDLVIVGSHGRGGAERAQRVQLGSVADYVLEHAKCPTLLVPVERP